MINTAWKLVKIYDPNHSRYVPGVTLIIEKSGGKATFSIPISEGLAAELSPYFTVEAQTTRDIMIEGPVIEGSVS